MNDEPPSNAVVAAAAAAAEAIVKNESARSKPNTLTPPPPPLHKITVSDTDTDKGVTPAAFAGSLVGGNAATSSPANAESALYARMEAKLAEMAEQMIQQDKAADADDEPEKELSEEELAKIDEDAGDEVQYKKYRPAKLSFGRPHPDPVVENASLAAVQPPDVTCKWGSSY